MKIKNINFGEVFVASGTLNFFGDGWWYDKLYEKIFPGFRDIYDCTLVAKTTTWYNRPGNMPLKENLQPQSLLPRCIKVYPLRGMILNSVGLSGSGTKDLLSREVWQKKTSPFVISFMAVGKNLAERLEEAQLFIARLKIELPKFRTLIMVQVNMSCPNTGHRTEELAQETFAILTLFAKLGVPIDLKINVLFPVSLLKEITDSNLCDVITVSNTIPYGACPDDINWKRLFWWRIFWGFRSPLHKLGGGGLSGTPILPVVLKKIREIKKAGINKPLKGCGGIMSRQAVIRMYQAGVQAIELGSVAIIRPWRIRKMIRLARKLFRNK